MRFDLRHGVAIATCLSLTSCAGGGAGPLGVGAILGKRNLAAAEPLFSKEEEKCMGSADKLISVIFGPKEEVSEKKGAKDAEKCIQVKNNLRVLLPVNIDGTMLYIREQRNELMDALIATSNRKCLRYTALLKNADGAMNAGLSVGAIVTGGLGSILPNGARALSGSAAILSGSRAALNDTYLSNQTIQVLAAAFDKARRTQRRVITNRQACAVDKYSLMRGVEDALIYHESCSLAAGLAETALSIERSENPGLSTMRTQLNELANLRRQADELSKDGPITPIAAAPSPISLEKVQAADQALTDAGTALKAAVDAQALATKTLSDANIALAKKTTDNQKESDDVDKAKADLNDKNEAVLKLTVARDKATDNRNAEVHALVRATSQTTAAVELESRVCPYG